MLQFQSVPGATLDVLKLLSGKEFLKDFRLVGGTALALFWGHRVSVDLDFFTDQNVNLDVLEKGLDEIEDSRMDSKNPIGRIYTLKKVKCDFPNYPYPFQYPVPPLLIKDKKLAWPQVKKFILKKVNEYVI